MQSSSNLSCKDSFSPGGILIFGEFSISVHNVLSYGHISLDKDSGE